AVRALAPTAIVTEALPTSSQPEKNGRAKPRRIRPPGSAGFTRSIASSPNGRRGAQSGGATAAVQFPRRELARLRGAPIAAAMTVPQPQLPDNRLAMIARYGTFSLGETPHTSLRRTQPV